MSKGQTVTVYFRIYELPCKSLTEYFSIFSDIRKDFDKSNGFQNTVPFYKAFKAVENKYNIYNWVSREEFYKSSVSTGSVFSEWQTGWVGGGMSTYPCLVTGSCLSKERSQKTLDFLFRKIVTDNGYMHGIYAYGRPYGDNYDPGQDDDVLMVRKFTDAIYFLLKQFLWLEAQDLPISNMWRKQLRKSLTALHDLYKENGQFGQFVDISTGKLLVRGTSGAATGIGALALGGIYYQDKKLLEAAKDAGEYYYREYLQKGISNGGPGEICQCPDSESVFGLLESYITLYDITGETQWIECACAAADLASSWCVAYDYKFPERSQFAKRGIRTTGTVWASVQNKHAAPGICTLSGVSLFKLYRATGKEKYLGLFKEITHNLMQYVSLEEHPLRCSWGGASNGVYSPEGFVDERCNMSDWEGEENVGEIIGGSCWCEVSVLLTYAEAPGIYVIKDLERVYAFDHIDCRIVQTNNDRLLLRLENETDYDAVVTVFEENSRQQGRSMGINPWDRYHKVTVKKHDSVMITLNK